MEYFTDRDDNLVYRSVRYEDNLDRDLNKILKITEHFDQPKAMCRCITQKLDRSSNV